MNGTDGSQLELLESFESHHHCGQHVVHFYGGAEKSLGPTAGKYLREGLMRDESVVAIATHAHKDEISTYLKFQETDPSRICWIDSEKTLEGLLVNGWPSWDRFNDAVHSALEAVDSGHGVRFYGDMVALLWDHNQFAAAIEAGVARNRAVVDFNRRLAAEEDSAAFAAAASSAHDVVGKRRLDDADVAIARRGDGTARPQGSRCDSAALLQQSQLARSGPGHRHFGGCGAEASDPCG